MVTISLLLGYEAPVSWLSVANQAASSVPASTASEPAAFPQLLGKHWPSPYHLEAFEIFALLKSSISPLIFILFFLILRSFPPG